MTGMIIRLTEVVAINLILTLVNLFVALEVLGEIKGLKGESKDEE